MMREFTFVAKHSATSTINVDRFDNDVGQGLGHEPLSPVVMAMRQCGHSFLESHKSAENEWLGQISSVMERIWEISSGLDSCINTDMLELLRHNGLSALVKKVWSSTATSGIEGPGCPNGWLLQESLLLRPNVSFSG